MTAHIVNLFFSHAKIMASDSCLDRLTSMSCCRSPPCHSNMASLHINSSRCAASVQSQWPPSPLQAPQHRLCTQKRLQHAVSPFISVQRRPVASGRARPATRCSAASAQAESRGSKIRLIQHKEEAFWFYRFLSIVYDTVVNPGHWTEDMRTDALSVAELQNPDLKASRAILSSGPCCPVLS